MNVLSNMAYTFSKINKYVDDPQITIISNTEINDSSLLDYSEVL